ncbi:MAG: hypothetical protein EPO26_06520 [Chloroflexota bacterium]|nr:MAG: hypothetical protein EPO26_06520 [Chloroflexota bacterium]
MFTRGVPGWNSEALDRAMSDSAIDAGLDHLRAGWPIVIFENGEIRRLFGEQIEEDILRACAERGDSLVQYRRRIRAAMLAALGAGKPYVVARNGALFTLRGEEIVRELNELSAQISGILERARRRRRHGARL